MKILKQIIFAISFLTIIPFKNIEFSDEDIKNSIKFFPVVGLLIGLILFFISKISINLTVKTFIILFIWELLSGFFHLDGVADTSDAIFSSRVEKENLFKIMSDSNIGTMGAVFVFFILLGKYLFLKEILIKNSSMIVIAPVVGRFAINFLSWRIKYAKENGLGKFICDNNSDRDFWISFIICLFIIVVINPKALFSFLIMIIFLFIYSSYFNKKFGGVTGDIFGFSVETIELLFMLLIIS